MQAICRPRTPPPSEEPVPPPVGPRGILGSISSLTHSETPPTSASDHPSLGSIGRRDSQGKSLVYSHFILVSIIKKFLLRKSNDVT